MTDNTQEFVFTRTLQAPAATVFRAFTDPALVAAGPRLSRSSGAGPGWSGRPDTAG